MTMRMRVLTLAVCMGLCCSLLAAAETVMVPMKDGVKLATDYYLPTGGDGKFPVVLVRTVYGKAAGAMVAPGFTGKGMACVVQDTRGRGASEGKDMVFADDGWGENKDGADTVKWVRAQPWCNGAVGTWGMSALGITQTLMAPAVPDLAAQAILVAADNFYGQLSYQGGVFRKALCETWIKGQKSEWVLPIWKKHPTFDLFWERYNAEAQTKSINAPAIHIGGWFDIFQAGTINNFYMRQHYGGEKAKGNQKLIVGPWPHGPAQKVGDLKLRDNFAQVDLNKQSLRFLEHWMTGVDNGIMKEPAVNYYTLGDVDDPNAPGNEWHTADDWPPVPTEATNFYLAEDGRLTSEAPTAEKSRRTFTYDPKDPCPTKGGQNLTIPAGPFDQREVSARPDVLRFATAPLETPLEVTGNVFAVLYVSSDAPDTDFTAKFVDIYPDGREILMLDSIGRLKLARSFKKAIPVAPGAVAKLTIDLWNISLVVNKGHRIGVQISSSNYPRFEKNPNTGDDFPSDDKLRVAQNTVLMDKDHPSALILPVHQPAPVPAEKKP